MKKIALVLCCLMMTGLYSCKKCSTCTYADPARGTLTSEDVCGKGKQYKHVKDIYKKNGWSCEDL
ncbi:MAG: hypothetical protein KDC83_12985 [Flavobacteriales bacterium]|nr:hypothetical protein [Flavobacteriales bacterium]